MSIQQGVLANSIHHTCEVFCGLQMCVRALKEEVTHVKMLYMAVCSILLSGSAMLFSPWGFSAPSWYGSSLLAACGTPFLNTCSQICMSGVLR